MPEQFGVFYTGTYDDHGTIEGLSQQDASTEEGQQVILAFVSAGLAAGASPITLTLVTE